jgi:hypothetical protein
MHRIAATLLILLTACGAKEAAPTEKAPEAAESAEHVGKAGCVGCQKRPEGVVTATGYRFDVQVWELPLERAEALYRTADAKDASLALLIDEKGLETSLRELAASDERVELFERPGFEVQAGKRALLPARSGGGERRWSDGLRLELGAKPTPGWAPNALDFACAWTSPQGEPLGRASGVTPLPYGHTVLLWCLPSKASAERPEPRTARAVVAIVRIEPTT